MKYMFQLNFFLIGLVGEARSSKHAAAWTVIPVPYNDAYVKVYFKITNLKKIQLKKCETQRKH